MSCPRHRRAVLVLMLSAGLVAAGCATGESGRTGPTDAPASRDATASGALDEAALIIPVRIAGGTVSPADTRQEVRVGRPVELVVDSDVEDELHVHATPEHTFPVAAGAGQRFRFTVDVPGRVEIELHKVGRTVATLLVRG
ncbi:hypothetical protein [Nocardia paucivorans]|uniref:hypothetical protein n=1 Tax=Nocardia paucivorans TaxID=114259 RepID=UPI0002F70685|nr:hypothetical protein [Nocardia paucivorans]